MLEISDCPSIEIFLDGYYKQVSVLIYIYQICK